MQGLNDFLQGPFDPEDESLDFAHGMLTVSAQAELKVSCVACAASSSPCTNSPSPHRFQRKTVSDCCSL